MISWEQDGEGKKVVGKKTEEVGLDNWPSRFKCPHGFTQLPWQDGGAGGFAPTRGESLNMLAWLYHTCNADDIQDSKICSV